MQTAHNNLINPRKTLENSKSRELKYYLILYERRFL